MFEDALDLFRKKEPTDSKIEKPSSDGKQILVNAAVHLVCSHTSDSSDDWFANTQEFPNGHVINKDEAGYYEALHILNCLANGRELCFNNLRVTQAWVDEAVETFMQDIDPIPRNLSITKSRVATADGALVDDLDF